MWSILGKFIPGVGPALVALSGAKWFWKVLNNWGNIRLILKDVETVVKQMLERKDTTPTCEEIKLLINAVKILFDKELIDLPMVNEADIARVLENVENNLVCSVSTEVKP